MKDAAFYINHLKLQPHPEGGYYKETYRSKGVIPASVLKDFNDDRNYSTAIYYLLKQGDFSVFHKIKSDECWHYYAGDVLLVHVLYNNGKYECIKLGRAIDKNEMLHFVVPANTWFAAECNEGSSFVLAGCTVAPGFDFADFKMADKERLLSEFPSCHKLILKLSK